jgi:hypothetical protein
MLVYGNSVSGSELFLYLQKHILFPVDMSEFVFQETGTQEAVLETKIGHVDKVLSFAENLDFINIQILRKFYATGLPFPNDTQPHVFSILYSEMKSVHKIPIGLEALRKRLDFLVKVGLIGKITGSNPASYYPIKGLEQSVRAIIKRFMMNHGLAYI